METSPDYEIELRLLLQAIYEKYNYDFRQYSRNSLQRRLETAMIRLQSKSLSILQDRVLHEENFFPRLLQYLTVPTSEMFRDPSFFLNIREKVVPVLRTYPSLKIWIAGCSTGEEIYTYAILLQEEGLLDRTTIYATDINPESLKKAEQGIFSMERIPEYTQNYQKAGGLKSFSDYFSARYEAAIFDKTLKANVVFADHSLATDSVFSEVQMVSCRNVMIYFDRELQNRALGLFHDSLSPKGFLGLGSKESLRFSAFDKQFEEIAAFEKIYRRRV
jgi:chemotaxis protein methyltransferase CheR